MNKYQVSWPMASQIPDPYFEAATGSSNPHWTQLQLFTGHQPASLISAAQGPATSTGQSAGTSMGTSISGTYVPLTPSISGNTAVTSNSASFYGFQVQVDMPKVVQRTAELPDIAMTGINGQGKKIQVVFEPEADISIRDLTKYVQLFVAYISTPRESGVCPLLYLEKHQLQRHFRYVEVN